MSGHLAGFIQEDEDASDHDDSNNSDNDVIDTGIITAGSPLHDENMMIDQIINSVGQRVDNMNYNEDAAEGDANDTEHDSDNDVLADMVITAGADPDRNAGIERVMTMSDNGNENIKQRIILIWLHIQRCVAV